LQAREIDVIAEKGTSKYLIECKFGRKQIDTALLDSYVMLYYNAKRSLAVNGLLFVCPSAGMSEHERSNVLAKYPGERIEIIESQYMLRELERL
jgi:predicted RecB family endonuclease